MGAGSCWPRRPPFPPGRHHEGKRLLAAARATPWAKHRHQEEKLLSAARAALLPIRRHEKEYFPPLAKTQNFFSYRTCHFTLVPFRPWDEHSNNQLRPVLTRSLKLFSGRKTSVRFYSIVSRYVIENEMLSP